MAPETTSLKPSARGAKGKPLPSPPPHDPELPLARLGWIRRTQLTALGKLGITTLRELLEHYPRRHEDRRRFEHFPEAEEERTFCLSGMVGKTLFRRFGRMRSFEAELREDSDAAFAGIITLRWFNLFHVQKSVLTGARLIVHGRVRLRGKRLCMEHPEFETVSDEDRASIHLDRVVPVHPAGEGISVRVIRGLIHRALSETDWSLWSDPMGSGRTDWKTSLHNIHFPQENEQIEPARRELALRELLGIQTLVTLRRRHLLRPRGTPKKVPGKLLGRYLADLPFRPTEAQSRAIAEMRADMERDHRMQRLLQGDVGSGKTLVAASVMMFCLEAGHRAVLMAPTQILAEQHHANFSRWLAPLGIAVSLLTGTRKSASRSTEGPVAVIGTHALLHDEEALEGAGLVVIDEQHKFGVLQRTRLATSPSAPDVLLMTATPIPRTLAQTLYGDLDLSILDERPPGRGLLRTAVRGCEKLPEITSYLRGQLDQGRRAYIVYPLVGESEKLTARAAEAEIAAWSERLAPHPCALLHGKMKAAEKEAVMESFRTGRTSVLVTTSVVEVGVDIPEATFLLIENAERFGLAQLHQLRGRIGRGEQTSTCVLLEGSGSALALERLRILERSNDGFVIAEEDLRLRGAGDILGTDQSGLPPLRVADLHRDADLIPVASAEAARILGEDPLLESPLHAGLRRLREAHSALLGAGTA
jgi:ATP-dependent DNA helicase RecG